MPARYIYSQNQTRVTCSRCNESRHFAGSHETADAVSVEDGTPIAQWLRYLPARHRFHSWCRECERQSRASGAANPNRASRRAVGRKFGVEIEVKMPRGRTTAEIENALRNEGLAVSDYYSPRSGWRVKGDGSLTRGNGFEICSPPIAGDEGFAQLEKVLRVLRSLGGKVDVQCGLHVHHDMHRTPLEQIKRFVRTWTANQGLIDGLVAPSRRGVARPTYCLPLGASEVGRLDAMTTTAQLRSWGVNRYRTLNLCAYGKFGTIEIRQHQGTLDFEKIRSWVLLGQAMIDAAATVEIPTQSRVRDLVARLGAAFDSTAATFTLGRAVEFGYAQV